LTDDSFVLIQSKSGEAATMDKEFEADAIRKGIMCTACDSIRPNASLDTVRVQGVISDAPFGMVTWGIGIARKDFLYCLGEDTVHRDLHIGSVETMKGRLLDNWVMYRAKHRILVRRGQDSAGIRYCETCGNAFYFALGDPYLVEPLPDKPDVDIFYSGASALVVRARLTQEIQKKKWKRVKFTPIEILDEPRDGLGIIDIEAPRPTGNDP
jgi:hypothetical protein